MRLYITSIFGITVGLLYGPGARSWLLSRNIDQESSGWWGALAGLAVFAATWWLLDGGIRALMNKRKTEDLKHKAANAEQDLIAANAQALASEAQSRAQRARLDTMSNEELMSFDYGSLEYDEYRRRRDARIADVVTKESET